MSMHKLAFTDSSLTDGQMAVWGGALEDRMMLAPAGRLSAAGLAAIEILSPAVLDACLARGENPLRRLDLARRHYGAVPLRATVNLLTGHGRRGADVLGPEAIDPWLATLAAAGLGQVVLLDPLLDVSRLGAALKSASAVGLVAIAALPYQADDRPDEVYAQLAASLAAAGAVRVMLRDESGVLTPDRVRTLIPTLVEALGATPLDLHTCCHTALGPAVVLEAAGLGVSGIDTALPCLANGASLPSSPSLLRALRPQGVTQDLPDRGSLLEADAILAAIADQEGFPQAASWPFDLASYAHQLPGEVAVEHLAALRGRGRWADLHEFAAECAAVRREMGSPPMVAPFARAIAEQASSHVDGEKRYESLRPVLRRLLQGAYGSVDGELRADLRMRVGVLPACETPAAGIEGPEALLAWIAGVELSALPPRTATRSPSYETLTPYESLVRGLLERAGRFAVLSLQGPGVRVHLQQEA
jgi:oxaloacetate decarboxylase (Na+ extruding) subunit alpha